MDALASPALLSMIVIFACGAAASATLMFEFGGACWRALALIAITATLLLALGLAHGGAIPVWSVAASTALIAAAIAAIDARRFIIPDALALALAVLAIAASANPWLEMALGAGLLGGLFFAVRAAHQSLRRAEGLGLGDVKLAAAIGLLLGPQLGLWVVAAAAGSTALWLAARRVIASGDAPPTVAPFGAPLALFAAFAMTWRAMGGAP